MGTWRMREQCVPGSLSSSHAQEPGNEATLWNTKVCVNQVVHGFIGKCLGPSKHSQSL